MKLRPRWFEAAFLATIVPADFIMARSHLRAIKRLAETTHTQTFVRLAVIAEG